MERFLRRWADVLLAAALLVVVASGVVIDDGPPDGWSVVLLVVLCAPLAVRRRRPVAVMLVCLAASALYHLGGYPHEPALVPLLFALYTVAAAREHRRVTALGGALAVLLVAWDPSSSFQELVGAISSIGLAVALGEISKARRAAVATASERAERAERAQEAEAAMRVAETQRRLVEERLRIARDLHDVLAHSISVINVQASVAAHLATVAGPRGDRDHLVTAISAIAEESRTSMAELRAVLGVLRSPAATELDALDEASPAPGLHRLVELAAAAHARGVDILPRTTGTPRPLPPAIDLTAYRVLQEALTNVARHAPGATAEVAIDYGDAALRVEVLDSGTPRPSVQDTDDPQRPSGYGLQGMAERVAAVGGTLHAGPRAGGGFAVRVDLPLDGSATPMCERRP